MTDQERKPFFDAIIDKRPEIEHAAGTLMLVVATRKPFTLDQWWGDYEQVEVPARDGDYTVTVSLSIRRH